MVAEKAFAPEGQERLLRHAAEVLRERCKRGGYGDVSPVAAAELSSRLESIAESTQDREGIDREEAVALAHRLIDDDHPELSPMWPGPST